jgi:uncharacterized protein YidB (DUF937 family)
MNRDDLLEQLSHQLPNFVDAMQSRQTISPEHARCFQGP